MSAKFYFYKKQGALQRINLEEIIVLKAAGNYTQFVTATDIHIIRANLDTALSQLPDALFVRIHRSYAVNLQYVIQVKKDTLRLSHFSEEELFISRPYYEGLIKKLVILEEDRSKPKEKNGMNN